jgi:hypothetical protein
MYSVFWPIRRPDFSWELRKIRIYTKRLPGKRKKEYGGRILGRNPDKYLKSFPPCYSKSPLQFCREKPLRVKLSLLQKLVSLSQGLFKDCVWSFTILRTWIKVWPSRPHKWARFSKSLFKFWSMTKNSRRKWRMFKGTVAWDEFFAYLIEYRMVI